MKITHLRTNHMKNPLGYFLGNPVLSWKVREAKGKKTKQAVVKVAQDPKMEQIICEITGEEVHSYGTELAITLNEATRYYWNVNVITDGGENATSETAWFETSKNEKSWDAEWITPDFSENGIVYQNFSVEDKIINARLSISAVGLYEVYIDGKKVGDEYFTPSFNDYDSWIQFQTYDIAEMLQKGDHIIEIIMGSGWYKGRHLTFSEGTPECKYGDCCAAIAELKMTFSDKTEKIVKTDCNWKSRKSKIREDSIYDGEVYDDTYDNSTEYSVKIADIGTERLQARLSLPVRKMHTLKPKCIIKTLENETLIDFGQNMAGWVTFYNRLPKGQKCTMIGGEILQNECFYHDNMRSAKTQFTYISDGVEKWVRPHFTYFGFRYMKIEGFAEDISLEDFEACVLYSDMEQTGTMTTGHEKVNQLISNILWGQRSNFIDVPTDCPQRDERLGWTGDTQIFCETASFNMDTQEFYRKHMLDVWYEQQKNNGMVPMVVPDLFMTASSAAWGDVATIVPWKQYLMYGDKQLLKKQYPGMKAWVDYIQWMDNESGSTRLWKSGTHFGDWVSLDATDGQDTGGTDVHYIATAYYYHSADLTERAANVLGLEEDAKKYNKLKEEIKTAFQREYFTPSGRLVFDTQTAYVVALYFELCQEKDIPLITEKLVNKLREKNDHLTTGFVGTPYLCPVLSTHGYNDKAYTLLLNEDFPSWLYAVNMGATTIWERWNSVLPDGTMHPDGMNSLNHYAYGSIQEWMYQTMLGIKHYGDMPAWEKIVLCPQPDRRIGSAEAVFDSPMGKIVSKWNYDGDKIHFYFEVPFDTDAEIRLPDGQIYMVSAGAYQYEIKTEVSEKKLSVDDLLEDLIEQDDVTELLETYVPEIIKHKDDYYQGKTLRESISFVFNIYTLLDLEKIKRELENLELK